MLVNSCVLRADDVRLLVGDRPIMLEIGCHDGKDTVKFLAAMPNIRLFCFEPDARPVKRFKNVRCLADSNRVTIYEEAITDVDGICMFFASTGKAGRKEDWDLSGSLCKPTGHLIRSPEIKFKPPIPVSCIRLDTWLFEHLDIRQIDFAWVDIQGAQRNFITGGKLALTITRYLYIECHSVPLYEGEPTQDELIELLPGFKPLATYSENILFQNRHDLDPGE